MEPPHKTTFDETPFCILQALSRDYRVILKPTGSCWTIRGLGLEDVESATVDYVSWHNERGFREWIGYIPPMGHNCPR